MTLMNDPLIGELVHELGEQGVAPETYTIYEHVDPDALKRVVTSADNPEVRLTIEGVQLRITRDNVQALN